MTSPREKSPTKTRTRTDEETRRARPKSSKMDAKTLTSATVAKLCERAAGG